MLNINLKQRKKNLASFLGDCDTDFFNLGNYLCQNLYIYTN